MVASKRAEVYSTARLGASARGRVPCRAGASPQGAVFLLFFEAPMERTLVIIPTYNEADNVRPIAGAVLENLPEAHLLFVDDNSPDGTGALADGLAAGDARIHVLHRDAKDGLGRAYVAGFKWALERGYEFVFEMDADFSHDPKTLPAFVAARSWIIGETKVVVLPLPVEPITIEWQGELNATSISFFFASIFAATGIPSFFTSPSLLYS